MGITFNIQKFCVNDGPGIRTTVFLKGCPLDCIWCHNPESKSKEKELSYSEKKCINCGRCIAVCPNGCHTIVDNKHIFHRENCINCFKCADACPSALEILGEEKTVDEVIKEVLKDKAFYDNSNGGLTISGGEPFFQFEFMLELLKKAKENEIHTAVETSGFCSKKQLLEAIPFIDLFLFDYKVTGEENCKKYTKADFDVVLSNLKLIDENNKETFLRCPIIPGVNDNEEHFKAIGKIADEFDCIKEINVEPYHPLGIGKLELIGKASTYTNQELPKEELKSFWLEEIKKQTSKKVCFG